MRLTGLHLLLTYQCTFECDHCFAWGSPWQSGTMTLANIRRILEQARSAGTVEWIYFEGGEPFLYHPILVQAVRESAAAGFKVGVVTNAYWAGSVEDATAWLRPLAGLVQDLTVSSDLFHWSEKVSVQARNASAAAGALGMPAGMISVARPEFENAPVSQGQLPAGESGVMFRGRAAVKLAPAAPHHPWASFSECPHEELREPDRVHVDPLGNLHLCQGIVLGNLYREDLVAICERFEATAHPVIGPLLAGGPAELVRRYGLDHEERYADACHLCYAARLALRERFPELLGPDQMYGAFQGAN